VARERSKRLDVEVEGWLQAAREGVVSGDKMGAERAHQLIEEVCLRFAGDALQHDRRERIRLRDPEAGDSGLDRGDVAEMLREQYEGGALPVAEAVRTLKRHGVTLTPDALSDLFYALKPEVLRARTLIEADRDAAARGEPRVELENGVRRGVGASGGTAAVEQQPMSLAKAVEKYKADRISTGKWSEATASGSSGRLDRFVASMGGGDVQVADISRDSIRTWRDSLGLRPHTVRQRIQMASSLFSWLVDEGVVQANPATNLSPKVPSKKAAESRKAYTRKDIELLFGDKLTSYRDRFPMFFWVPLLALYSGARVTELCQLAVNDVRRVKGIHCIEIRAAIDGQQLKNDSSERTVPIHSHLIQLGFLDYVAARRKSDEAQPWVFAGRTPPERKEPAGSRMSIHWAEQRAGKTPGVTPRTVFHSLRKLVVDEWKAQGVPGYLMAQVLGHHDPSMSTGVYGALVSVEQLSSDVIELLDFSKEVAALAHLPGPSGSQDEERGQIH
jgi:integrase